MGVLNSIDVPGCSNTTAQCWANAEQSMSFFDLNHSLNDWEYGLAYSRQFAIGELTLTSIEINCVKIFLLLINQSVDSKDKNSVMKLIFTSRKRDMVSGGKYWKSSVGWNANVV